MAASNPNTRAPRRAENQEAALNKRVPMAKIQEPAVTVKTWVKSQEAAVNKRAPMAKSQEPTTGKVVKMQAGKKRSSIKCVHWITAAVVQSTREHISHHVPLKGVRILRNWI